MRLSSFVEGVEILSKYYKSLDGHHMGADHDIIYLCETDKIINDKDVFRLWELGFFQEGLDEEYDPEESWQCYV